MYVLLFGFGKFVECYFVQSGRISGAVVKVMFAVGFLMELLFLLVIFMWFSYGGSFSACDIHEVLFVKALLGLLL